MKELRKQKEDLATDANKEAETMRNTLIAAEAGGVVSDRRGDALRFNKAQPVTKGAIVAGPRLHQEIINKSDAH